MPKQAYNFTFTLKDAPGEEVLTHQIRAMNETEAWRRFYRWVGNHPDKIVPDIIALRTPEAKEELKTTLDCWINEPYLALTNPPKLIWKCRYCGNEISTAVNSIPDKICACLKEGKQ